MEGGEWDERDTYIPTNDDIQQHQLHESKPPPFVHFINYSFPIAFSLSLSLFLPSFNHPHHPLRALPPLHPRIKRISRAHRAQLSPCAVVRSRAGIQSRQQGLLFAMSSSAALVQHMRRHVYSYIRQVTWPGRWDRRSSPGRRIRLVRAMLRVWGTDEVDAQLRLARAALGRKSRGMRQGSLYNDTPV